MVLANFMLVTLARKKAFENIRAFKTDKDGEYLETNFVQISYI